MNEVAERLAKYLTVVAHSIERDHILAAIVEINRLQQLVDTLTER